MQPFETPHALTADELPCAYVHVESVVAGESATDLIRRHDRGR